jgi:hypothetical protein
MRGGARGRGGGGRGQPSFRGAVPVVAAPTTTLHQAVPRPAPKKKTAKKKTVAVEPASNAFDQIAPQKTIYVLNDDLYSRPSAILSSLPTRSNSRVSCVVRSEKKRPDRLTHTFASIHGMSVETHARVVVLSLALTLKTHTHDTHDTHDTHTHTHATRTRTTAHA